MSPKNRRVILALVAGVLLVGGFFLIRGGPPRSDEEQIRDLLTEGERAVEAKDLSGVMRLVSKDFKMSELNRDRLRLLIIQAFRDTSTLYVTLNNVSVQPQGDTATVSATVTVEAQGKEATAPSTNTYPVTFQLRKEPGQRLLVLPAQHWRVVEASGTGFEIGGGLLDF